MKAGVDAQKVQRKNQKQLTMSPTHTHTNTSKVYLLILRICEYATLQGNKNFADLTEFSMLAWGGYPRPSKCKEIQSQR